MKLFKIYQSSLSDNVGRIIYISREAYTFKFYSKHKCVELINEYQSGFADYRPIQL
ncbi:MAG: hypothetical protein ACRCX2_04525 [Paraclostridium sp.]